MSYPLFKHTIPDGASIGPKSPGIVLIWFEAAVAIYSLGYDSISTEFAEPDTQPFPVGIRVDVLFISAAIAAEKSAAGTDTCHFSPRHRTLPAGVLSPYR